MFSDAGDGNDKDNRKDKKEQHLNSSGVHSTNPNWDELSNAATSAMDTEECYDDHYMDEDYEDASSYVQKYRKEQSMKKLSYQKPSTNIFDDEKKLQNNSNNIKNSDANVAIRLEFSIFVSLFPSQKSFIFGRYY